MTVSRVINHKGDVNEETRRRVLKIIKDLNYRPSAIARSLATQQTRTIGLVIPDVSNPYFAAVATGIEHVAYAQGYHVFLCNTEEDPQRELALIQSLEEKRVDGLALCSSRLEDAQLREVLSRLPVAVLINRWLDSSDDDTYQSVILDDERGGWMATQHLIDSGHRCIGFLAGPPNSFSGRGRHKGYLAALETRGITPEPDWVQYCQPSVEGGQHAAQRLLKQRPDLTALFCFNDLVAVGALQTCAELGLQVPEQMAVVGHDDIPLAGLVSPALTTCRVPGREMGAQAVDALLKRLQECPDGCSQIVLQPELIIRQSAP